MKTPFLFLTLLAVILPGCSLFNPGVKVPKTDLHVETDAWQVRLRSEKDTQLEGLAVNISPDGAVAVALPKFTATNSPIVIRETGKAQAVTIDAQGRVLDAAGKHIGQVVDGAVKLFALP